MKTIFVSSTFKDMQFERDCLSAQVLPSINALARKYGDSVALCDLRWGINTFGLDAEQSDKKILDACLHEIDNCRPYMIVFLGERYGWVPGNAFMKRTIENYAEFKLPDYDISVTALEIEYGAFYDAAQFSRTLFYFRENSGDVPADFSEADAALCEKLTALKNRIKSIKGARVHTYTLTWSEGSEKPEGLEALSEKIIGDISALMLEDWQKLAALTEYERERRIQWAHAEKHAATYYTRHTRLDLCNFLLDNGQPFFAIVNGDGTGKTALIGKLACDRRQTGVRVLPVFCGLTARVSSAEKITKYVLGYLKETFGEVFGELDPEAEGDEDFWREQFARAMTLCGRLEAKLEFYFDEVDLVCSGSLTDVPFFCADLPENVSLVLSCATRAMIPEGFPCLPSISPPDYFDTKHIMEGQLTGTHKELDDAVMREIVYKKDSTNPLYLKMALQRLALLDRTDFQRIAANGGDISAIIEYQKQMIRTCGHSVTEMCAQLVAAVTERINPDLGKAIADYICASHKGISEEELRRLFERKGLAWSPLDFRIIMQFLEGLVCLRSNGRYDLVYSTIKASFRFSPEVYADLMGLLEEKETLTEEDVAAYVYYCLYSENHDAYLNFLFTHPAHWKAVASSTVTAMQNKYSGILSSASIELDLTRWTHRLLQDAKDVDAVEVFEAFFRREFNEACSARRLYWRTMAKEVYGEWSIVNKIECTPKERPGAFPKSFGERLHIDEERWKDLQKGKRQPIRREHLIPADLREYEFEISGHRFYFFSVPRAEDVQLFFMRDDCILLAFYRSSVGDHCTYDVAYNESDGSLTVIESDFCHYDVESDISIYTFARPLAEEPSYTCTHDTRRGAYNLPLHFAIQKK